MMDEMEYIDEGYDTVKVVHCVDKHRYSELFARQEMVLATGR